MATQKMLNLTLARDAESVTHPYSQQIRRDLPRVRRPKAAEQASRCRQCGCLIASACRCTTNIPELAEADRRGALQEPGFRRPPHLPEICGRICPQAGCAKATASSSSRPRNRHIGAVEKYITDTAWEQGGSADPPMPSGQKAWAYRRGPRGLAAADVLRRQACRSRSMTAMTAPGASHYAFGLQLEKPV